MIRFISVCIIIVKMVNNVKIYTFTYKDNHQDDYDQCQILNWSHQASTTGNGMGNMISAWQVIIHRPHLQNHNHHLNLTKCHHNHLINEGRVTDLNIWCQALQLDSMTKWTEGNLDIAETPDLLR